MTGADAASPVANERAASQVQAHRTRSASSSAMQWLSPPATRPAFLTDAPLAPDPRYGRAGRVRMLLAYDVGLPPPPLPEDSIGARLQPLSAQDTLGAVMKAVGDHYTMRGLPTFVQQLLDWLSGFPGETWEERWLSSGADGAPQSLGRGIFAGNGAYGSAALNRLLLAGVIRPSYGWQLGTRGGAHLERKLLDLRDPDTTAAMRRSAPYSRGLPRHQADAEKALARVVIRTGRRLGQLRGDDLLHYADVVRTSGRHRREHLAWELMVAVGAFDGEPPTLRAAWSAKGNTRQHSTSTLVDRYGIPPSGVRDLLVDYLSELRPGMDYGSLEKVAYRLARLFWWELLQLNPDQQDLRLTPDLATRWRERLSVTTDGKNRQEVHSILFAIRALYRDLAEWSHDEPVRWGIWVAPCPVARAESRHASKARRRQRSRMQDRTRALTPLLPALIAAAERRRDWFARLLTAAEAAGDQEQFAADGMVLQRCERPPRSAYEEHAQVWARVVTSDPNAPTIKVRSNGLINVTAAEADGFWAWAIIETLRHTGIRVEELMELTQLSLRHYTSTRTGTLVPLLHIVPSKNDIERLIPMSPDLVSVLLAVVRRAKGGEANVPLSVRYDHIEKVHGQPLPHLFDRRVGTRQEVISYNVVRRLLNDVAADANLTDAGQPITFTAHDFRRLFSTEIVGAGLPLHIAATLLGHLSLETTRGYTAVFPEEVIAAHQHLIEQRRQRRPDGELRDATQQEWDEFEDHFLLRKVALGDCRRPYGTPCIHEHACARCRFLSVDPAQLPRIEEMTCNAEARLDEAHGRAWLGEVAALEESLIHLRRRRDEALHKLSAPVTVG